MTEKDWKAIIVFGIIGLIFIFLASSCGARIGNIARQVKTNIYEQNQKTINN